MITNTNDGLKNISKEEFDKKLREYSSKIKKKPKIFIPNEPGGYINKSIIKDDK